MLISTLGQILASRNEEIRLRYAELATLERIQDDIRELPEKLADCLSDHLQRPPGILALLGVSPREMAMIVLVVVMGLVGLAEGRSIRQVISEAAPSSVRP